MIKAFRGWAVLSYDKEEDVQETQSGILLPTARNQRINMKGKTHVISSDPDAGGLPDVIRIGTVVSASGIETGAQVLFNKHDGFGFQLDDQYLYLIKEELIAAWVAGDKVEAA